MIDVKPYEETWENFGATLKAFFDFNRTRLCDENFDLIMGFSRGGLILATVISCMISDLCLEKGKRGLTPLRSIPGGIAKKSYRDSCFLMMAPVSNDELDDIEKLKEDLISFKGTKDSLKILLVDDNLTGSSRLYAIKKKIEEEIEGSVVKTLTYVRHHVFTRPKIDYVVREYPEGADYFVMPWHIVHHARILMPLDEIITVSLMVETTPQYNFSKTKSKIIKYLKTKNPFLQFVDEENILGLIMGENRLWMKKMNNHVLIKQAHFKYYAPKKCLEGGIREEGEPLCKIEGRRDAKHCFVCSFLNCCGDVITHIKESSGVSNKIKMKIGDKEVTESLSKTIEKWWVGLKK